MRTIPALPVLLLVAGAVFSGCLSSDNTFVDTLAERGTAIAPLMHQLNQSVTDRDFNASRDACSRMLVVEDTYLPRLAAIRVSGKYNTSKQYFLTGIADEQTGCRMMLDRPDSDLGPAMQYITRSADDFSLGVQAWPE